MTNIRATQVPIADPLWVPQTLADLDRHEGYRQYAYPDPLSKIGKLYRNKKYGWGYRPARIILAELGLNAKDGIPWTVGHGFTRKVTPDSTISFAHSKQRLKAEMIEHAKGLDTLIPGWRSEHAIVYQTVLVNMIYNLGTQRLSKFAPTLALIKHRNYDGAADRLERTAWYKQVGDRAKELVKRLRTGQIEPQHKV